MVQRMLDDADRLKVSVTPVEATRQPDQAGDQPVKVDILINPAKEIFLVRNPRLLVRLFMQPLLEQSLAQAVAHFRVSVRMKIGGLRSEAALRSLSLFIAVPPNEWIGNSRLFVNYSGLTKFNFPQRK